MRQLILFLPMLLYGFRASEPCYLMIEDWDRGEDLLRVACIPELDYKTKGGIDKTFPMPPIVRRLLARATCDRAGRPLLPNQACFEKKRTPPCRLKTKQDVIHEYRRRLDGNGSALHRLKLFRGVFTEAGGVSYAGLDREFRKVVHLTDLGNGVTLKALRHHFARALEQVNISYFTRKYLMGHRVRRDPLAVHTTTGFGQIRREFDRLLRGSMASILTAARQRISELALTDDSKLSADGRLSIEDRR